MSVPALRAACCLGGLWVALAAGLGPAADQAAPATALVPGHSYHGEVFNEGPRQRAYLMGTTGPVRFAITTSSPEAQQFFNQGVGQLHGFWYFEAERSFRQAAVLDPNCAMAYWGMALANTNNEKRAKGFLAEAVKRKEASSDREKMYIDALDALYKADSKKNKERYEAYARAFEQILYKYPDDIEARALLALQLWLNRNHGSQIDSHLAVDALLKQVLAVEPLHPCHHYRIHLWDGHKTEFALDSAARCGQSAPGIAHMWHMPGHIYSGLQRYADAVWQQEASARVDHAYMIRDRILPDQIHNYAHNNEWLIRNLTYVGRVHDAIDLAKNLVELPRHPSYNTLHNGRSTQFGRQRLFDDLTRYELWDELIALCQTLYLEPTDDSGEQLKRLRHLGAAYFRKGDVDQGRKVLAEVEGRLIAALGLPPGSERRPDPVLLPSKDDGSFPPPTDLEKERENRLRPIELAIDELRGHLAAAQGDYQPALPLLKRAGGVGALFLAKVEYLAGNRDQALKDLRERINQHKNEVLPLAALAEALWQAGEQKEAGERFAQLRELSGQIDLDIPPFARLAPIAASLGLPQDWRIPKPPAADVGERPDLASLGPYRWHPSPAPDWQLPDAQHQQCSLAQYRGKPVVVIFYLGYQCLHCAEQLQAFAPLTKEFQDAGLSIIAISTDDEAGLQKSLESYKSGAFPFPLVSDAGLGTFKAYRAYDDFENKPLHGTFVIDGAGLVRWQDISYEPFKDARFVLNEARRLLGLPAPASGKLAARE